MGTITLQTLGCKLNRAETESLARQFIEAGYQVVSPDHEADIYLLNTCTVTWIADRKCRNLLRQAHRRNPHALIVAAGCYAERAAEELSRIEGVGLVSGNREKGRLAEIVMSRANGYSRCKAEVVREGSLFLTRALVKIQEGCNHPCSFCIVPKVRGREQSRPQDEIIAEIRSRAAEGYKEIVLTGTRIGSYSGEGGLRGLVEGILRESDVPRVRLSSLEPGDVKPELLELWQDGRVCPHIHMSLQSGCDAVLQRMGRAYSAADFEQAVKLARQAISNLSLTTDIIVGFPGESEHEFREGYSFCERMAFSGMHVFPYSARPGTKAAKMPGRVNDVEKKQRCQTMLALAQKGKESFRERFLGQRMDVLWEGNKDGVWFGLTDNYMRVVTASREHLANQIVAVKLVAQHEGILFAESIVRQGVRL